MRPLILIFTLLFAVARTSSAQTCPPGDAARAAMLSLGLQNKLLAHKLDDGFELDASTTVEKDIVMLRKTLDVATQAFFHCEAGDTSDPQILQSELASFLHTDRSKRDETSLRDDGVYGANLRVKVEPADGLSKVVFVTLSFGISCGDDHILLLFSKDTDQWRENLHWYSANYTKPSDAFGDFFTYALVPGPDKVPLVAVAHGHPWCTSRFSNFDVDLLRPATESSPQLVLAHVNEEYDRLGPDPEKIRPTPDGFKLRISVTAASPTQSVRIATFQYRTTAQILERVQAKGKR